MAPVTPALDSRQIYRMLLRRSMVESVAALSIVVPQRVVQQMERLLKICMSPVVLTVPEISPPSILIFSNDGGYFLWMNAGRSDNN